ncbi:HAD family hydrolase [Paramaledivibacter caminithermalis]|uniref:Haloacid dehalogenase superfamily, subfamily IA, variant 3 with third motif having DD or ED/haloacid dehalogenase superfamily, subfamily IA, variant 1 with third motif having Dx(3-4)D or Dx(3-4)E n=1 Tax=Paramaledivibacter caminithermalis (strain DSM 15212 / CIP 107654 / DViRD3) TaxID=1121301 RepID=A0A1M6M0W4_PARC5|nr:HAD family phosphatase [Paramaledivibacter caminithermalis]SHJ77149.1 haloacid dehalogenase superfamily, subfamily IA, variant 3 with third motif having DD or ED/haloacid dehalogenase superfamily, subfamily IA, variant 1 with third motif having Dx(3-4)D or Dx(3-4)E [Paramaledivibacter caminithermalis DSM 15212]
MLEGIKAVIFDLDGTIVDSMWIWKEIDIKYLAKRGIKLPDGLQKEIEGMSFTETAIYFKKTFSLKETIEEIKEEWNLMAYDFYRNKINLKYGVKEFIELIKSKDIKLGIGTSNSRELALEVLKKHNIYDYFDTIRTSCEVEKGKPHPHIFLKVAEDLGVKPQDCIVFEDTYAGVLAAKRAGMRVIAISDELSLPYKKEICDLAENYIEDYIDIA